MTKAELVEHLTRYPDTATIHIDAIRPGADISVAYDTDTDTVWILS